MLTRGMGWVALVASVLLVALSLLLPAHAITLLAGFVVWAGLVVSLIHALSERMFGWAALFAVFGIVYNPVLPIHLPSLWLLGVNLACVAVFAASLVYVHRSVRLTIESIVDSAPRSESL